MLSLSSEIDSRIKGVFAFVLYAGLFASASCSGSELGHQGNARGVETPAVKAGSSVDAGSAAQQLAGKLTELYDKKSCKEFFNSFPDTFERFEQLYGYDDATGPRPLYSRPEHVNYFFECPDVPDLEKLNKVIRIARRGKWDADSIGAFQDMAFKLMAEHPKETKDILDGWPEDEAASVWYFVFDGPDPNDKEIVKRIGELRERLGKDSKQSRMIAEQYEKLKADWSPH